VRADRLRGILLREASLMKSTPLTVRAAGCGTFLPLIPNDLCPSMKVTKQN
jgi:hypothetical protein